MQDIQRFDASEINAGEVAGAALAARETAEAQARFIVAIKRPRNVEVFRTRLLSECKRLGFAEGAEYHKPVGKKRDPVTGEWVESYADGPSIRFIEAAAQCYGNMDVRSCVINETRAERVIECAVIDLESNCRWSEQRILPRTTEKRGEKMRGSKEVRPPAGREVVGERTNSYGEPVYVCIATSDEMQLRQAAEASKGCRTLATRLLPKDIIAEALQVCRETMAKGASEDPRAAVRRVIDGFVALGVTPDDLEVWLGGKLEQIQPKQIQQLRSLWVGIKDGETTWHQVMEARDPQGSVDAAQRVAGAKIAALQPAAEAVTQKSGLNL